MHPVAHPLRPVAHPLRAMGSQWVRNGSATPPQRGLLGALRATPPPPAPPPRGALRVALRAQSLASRRRRAQALRLRSLAHARQQQHVQVTEVKEGRWRWRSSQQLHDVCQQAGTGRRGRCGLCAVQVMMTSGRTTGHRIAQSWRCRRARSRMRGLGCTRTAPQSGCAHAGVAGALDGLGQLGLRDSAGQAPGGRTVWSADEAARGVRVGHGRAHQRRRRRACRGGACRGSGGLLSLWQRNAQGRAVRRRAADTRVDVRGAPRRARAPTAAMAETPPPPAPTTIIRSGAAHRSGWFLLFAHLPRATRISVSVPIPVEAQLRIP